jgi:hypothetical protein
MDSDPILGVCIAAGTGECVAPLELSDPGGRGYPGFAPGAVIRASAGGGIRGHEPAPLLRRMRLTLQIAVPAALSSVSHALAGRTASGARHEAGPEAHSHWQYPSPTPAIRRPADARRPANVSRQAERSAFLQALGYEQGLVRRQRFVAMGL